ncbi:hypothetical protein [uncultured Ruminococcus sp.]|uniref:hypothetical protein n=1 Tax=uncultured Ruminococcus sp. TaxID=165186 RepID=UPI0025F921B8|nr:hypothetical protein [uncultured Ruminococcus sp.]
MAIKRLIFLILDCICLGLGTVGIFLPYTPYRCILYGSSILLCDYPADTPK